jgi:DNA-binding GntR family transcriptional regulator
MTTKSSRVDEACQALRRAIIEQSLPPGSKLPEDELCAHFKMSRTLVRATLARLHAEGLVDAPPRRTATTARPTIQEAKEIFGVRKALEREVVRLVIENWRAEYGAQLEGHIRAEDAARKESDARMSVRLAGEFHLRLSEMAGNALLQRYLSEVVSRCSLIIALYGRPHSAECAVNEHREILTALRGRDAQAVCALMDQHLGAVEERALLNGERSSPPDLGEVLGRYAKNSGTAPILKPPRKPPRRLSK